MNYTDATNRYKVIKSAAKKTKIQKGFNDHDIIIIAFQKISKSKHNPPHTTLDSLEKTCGHQHNYRTIINQSKDLTFIPNQPNLITFRHLITSTTNPNTNTNQNTNTKEN